LASRGRSRGSCARHITNWCASDVNRSTVGLTLRVRNHHAERDVYDVEPFARIATSVVEKKKACRACNEFGRAPQNPNVLRRHRTLPSRFVAFIARHGGGHAMQ